MNDIIAYLMVVIQWVIYGVKFKNFRECGFPPAAKIGRAKKKKGKCPDFTIEFAAPNIGIIFLHIYFCIGHRHSKT